MNNGLANTGGYPVEDKMHQISIRKETELNIKRLEDALAIEREKLQLLDENPIIARFMDLSRGIR